MLNYVLYGAIALIVALCVFLFLFPVIQICGYSMFPTMMDGEFHFGRRVFRKNKCRVGQIYVYKPPYEDREERFVIKRLAEVNTDRNGKVQYYFLGDNSNDSYDSRYYGYVDCRNVVAHIVLKKRGVK